MSSSYENRKEYMREYQRIWIAKRRADWFADKSCVVCGSTNNLELDHIDPSLKVANSILSWSKERQNIEIAKCQVLCHSHHVSKTVSNKDNARGEAIAASKLNENDIRLIRHRFKTEVIAKRQLARDFAIDEKVIRLILKGELWKDVI